VAGIAIIGLLPWKSLLARRSLLRRPVGIAAPASAALGLLLAISLAFGLVHSSGHPYLWAVPLLSSIPILGRLTAMEMHVGAALALLPFALGHVTARPVRPRATDLSRRVLLRTGLLLGASAATLAVLPSGVRGLTGSYHLAELPETSWLFDPVPVPELDRWSLLAGGRRWSHAELSSFSDRERAVIDCTGGWYSEQEWEGARLSRLLGPEQLAGALSISVRSATGYWRRFDVAEVPRLLLATRVGGVELAAGNGFPTRLVAPGWRGFWWVKWVVELRPETLPWWWQPPYPMQ
jgi:hypothetical protein